MRAYLLVAYSFFFAVTSNYAQEKLQVQLLTLGTNTSLRGMSISADKTIWVSGTNGTIGKSVDSGKSWRWLTIEGFEKKDFRDIEAFDSSTAIAMAVGNPAVIIKTRDGGATWKKVYEREMEGMFLDAMDFKDKKEGICIGDPINTVKANNKFFYIIKTHDGGETWQEESPNKLFSAQPGEAIFAASGTNIYFLNQRGYKYAFVTGGAVSKLYLVGRQGKKSKVVPIPVTQGKETAGTFSMATDRQKTFYCVGGDYKAPTDSYHNYAYTTSFGDKWLSPQAGSPFGYRSCIQIIKNKTLVTCGPSGVDFYGNGQKEWKKASLEGFNVCIVSQDKQVFFAGEKGKIGKLIY